MNEQNDYLLSEKKNRLRGIILDPISFDLADAGIRRSLLFLASTAPLFHKLRQEVGKLVKPSIISIDSYNSVTICVLLCLLLTRCD
jgi:hypothetical protein